MENQGGLLEKAGKVILILAFIGAGFFYLQKSCWAVSAGSVVINEIYGGGGNSGATYKNDFIELYNPTDYSVLLDGWSIQYASATGNFTKTTEISGNILAKSYYLIQEKAGSGGMVDLSAPDIIGNIAMAAKDGKVALVKNIEFITGKDDSDVIDFVGYGSANEYKGSGSTTNPGNTKSIERQQPGYNTDNNDQDFIVQDTPTPQNSGGELLTEEISEEGTEPLSPETTESGSVPESDETAESDSVPESDEGGIRNDNYVLGDVVINEFVSDPADGEVEWVELYNNTSQEINLEDWTIEEGSETKTNLEGTIGSSGEDKFLVIEKPKGNLNNKGDVIILRDNSGALIDQVAYGNWDDGDVNNNAPVAADPNSIARKFDGQNSYNNLNDFSVTTILTKGTSNIIIVESEEEEEELSAEEKADYDYSNDIVISEIFPNPEGSDSEAEFIELYNKGEREVNLTGWQLGDESKKRYRIKIVDGSNDGIARDDNILASGDYLAVYRSESGIALNNSSDSVKLYQPLKDEPLQAVKYEKAIENWSYNNMACVETETDIASSTGSLRRRSAPPQDDNYEKWVWSEIITPGEKNNIVAINHPPVVEFDCLEKIIVGQPVLFDSSDTVDEDGDELEFSWDFGDGIKLNLPCPEHTYLIPGDYVIKLIVSDGENEAGVEKIVKVVSNGMATSLPAVAPRNDGVVINEVLPNPEGADSEGEWVEIKNIGQEKINLLNWKLDDSEGGSQPFLFDSDLWLEAGNFCTIDRVDSGLALNNSVDAVRLFDNFDELVDEIEYEKVIEGESYARGQNDKLFWTTVLTPGEENVIVVSNSQAVSDAATQNSGIGNKSTATAKSENLVVETTLEKIKEFESGELVKVKGVVAVRPGVLGSQYFYIVGSPGIQVYNYKKDFPDLEVGDYIEVSGELSVVSGEQRLKTKTVEDMKIIERKEAPRADCLACENIDEELTGSLISVTGEVVERKSSVVYLDDGTDEIIVYIKTSTGINPKSIKEGDIISVTGIVGRTKSGLRVMPRSEDDIIKKDIESSDSVGQVLGEVAVSDEWEIAKRDKKLELFKYLLVIAGAAVVVLAGLLIGSLRAQKGR